MHQCVTDIVDMHIVGFAKVTLTSAFVGRNADTLVEPSEAFRHVAFVIQHLVDMGLHVTDALHRETANEDFKVVVVAFDLAKPVVGTSTTHRVGRDVVVVANEEDIT